jgi:hypothetical protein
MWVMQLQCLEADILEAYLQYERLKEDVKAAEELKRWICVSR